MLYLRSFKEKFLKLYRECAAEDNLNLPNLLTFIRIILVPIICYMIAIGYMASASAVYSIAAFTDWLDGFLARRWKQETILGKLLDPVADKLLMLPILFLIPHGLWNISAILIFLREIGVVFARFIMTSTSMEKLAGVKFHGKVKATVQYICVIYAINLFPNWNWGLFFAACLTFLSGLYYAKSLINFSFWPKTAKV